MVLHMRGMVARSETLAPPMSTFGGCDTLNRRVFAIQGSAGTGGAVVRRHAIWGRNGRTVAPLRPPCAHGRDPSLVIGIEEKIESQYYPQRGGAVLPPRPGDATRGETPWQIPGRRREMEASDAFRRADSATSAGSTCVSFAVCARTAWIGDEVGPHGGHR
jgi:hypothetical protein